MRPPPRPPQLDAAANAQAGDIHEQMDVEIEQNARLRDSTSASLARRPAKSRATRNRPRGCERRSDRSEFVALAKAENAQLKRRQRGALRRTRRRQQGDRGGARRRGAVVSRTAARRWSPVERGETRSSIAKPRRAHRRRLRMRSARPRRRPPPSPPRAYGAYSPATPTFASTRRQVDQVAHARASAKEAQKSLRWTEEIVLRARADHSRRDGASAECCSWLNARRSTRAPRCSARHRRQRRHRPRAPPSCDDASRRSAEPNSVAIKETRTPSFATGGIEDRRRGRRVTRIADIVRRGARQLQARDKLLAEPRPSLDAAARETRCRRRRGAEYDPGCSRRRVWLRRRRVLHAAVSTQGGRDDKRPSARGGVQEDRSVKDLALRARDLHAPARRRRRRAERQRVR